LLGEIGELGNVGVHQEDGFGFPTEIHARIGSNALKVGHGQAICLSMKGELLDALGIIINSVETRKNQVLCTKG
jgi:hypothetical protein